MNLKERVTKLANERHMSIAELERKLNFSNGSINKWDKQSPSVDRLNKIAEFFDVSMDYLSGKTDKRHYYQLTNKEENDLGVLADKMLAGTTADAEANFYGEPMTDDGKAALRAAIMTALEINKRQAKKKFTPKKFRDSNTGVD